MAGQPVVTDLAKTMYALLPYDAHGCCREDRRDKDCRPTFEAKISPFKTFDSPLIAEGLSDGTYRSARDVMFNDHSFPLTSMVA